MGLTLAKSLLDAQVPSPTALNRGPMIEEVQVTPPSIDRYMTFCLVASPPPPSSIAATNTGLEYLTLAPGGPGSAPVTCTSRMKLPLSVVAALQVTPSSEWTI